MAATSPSVYIIRGGVAGRERLRVLSRVMGPMTARLLERIGVAPGARCLDVGCGGGDVAMALARLVGPDGAVVGVDIDEVKLELARYEAADAGLDNVAYRHAGIDELPSDGAYDVAYARFLLSHLPAPAPAPGPPPPRRPPPRRGSPARCPPAASSRCRTSTTSARSAPRRAAPTTPRGSSTRASRRTAAGVRGSGGAFPGSSPTRDSRRSA